jgi:hypothetical protein
MGRILHRKRTTTTTTATATNTATPSISTGKQYYRLSTTTVNATLGLAGDERIIMMVRVVVKLVVVCCLQLIVGYFTLVVQIERHT